MTRQNEASHSMIFKSSTIQWLKNQACHNVVNDCHQRLANQPFCVAIDVADAEVIHFSVSPALLEVNRQGLSASVVIAETDAFEVVLQVGHVGEDLVGALRTPSQISFCQSVNSLKKHQSEHDCPPCPSAIHLPKAQPCLAPML